MPKVFEQQISRGKGSRTIGTRMIGCRSWLDKLNSFRCIDGFIGVVGRIVGVTIVGLSLFVGLAIALI